MWPTQRCLWSTCPSFSLMSKWSSPHNLAPRSLRRTRSFLHSSFIASFFTHYHQFTHAKSKTWPLTLIRCNDKRTKHRRKEHTQTHISFFFYSTLSIMERCLPRTFFHDCFQNKKSFNRKILTKETLPQNIQILPLL